MAAIQFTDRGTPRRVTEQGRALARAAVAALSAPSFFNTQPWRWRVGDDTAELHAHRSRRLAAVDPDGRMMIISCGAALHHARTALAATGTRAGITYSSVTGDQTLLATMRVGGPQEPAPDAMRLFRAMAMRRTDRRPFADRAVTAPALHRLQAAVQAYGAHLHYPSAEPVPVHDSTPGDGHRPAIHALPDGDRYTRYAVLCTDGDEPRDWLMAGQALSALLLTATSDGLTVSPMSDLAVTPTTQHPPRQTPAGTGHPAIVVRIGVPAGTPDRSTDSSQTCAPDPDGAAHSYHDQCES